MAGGRLTARYGVSGRPLDDTQSCESFTSLRLPNSALRPHRGKERAGSLRVAECRVEVLFCFADVFAGDPRSVHRSGVRHRLQLPLARRATASQLSQACTEAVIRSGRWLLGAVERGEPFERIAPRAGVRSLIMARRVDSATQFELGQVVDHLPNVSRAAPAEFTIVLNSAGWIETRIHAAEGAAALADGPWVARPRRAVQAMGPLALRGGSPGATNQRYARCASVPPGHGSPRPATACCAR